MSADLCPVTGLTFGVCTCDQCCPEASGTATVRTLCGWCTGAIRVGDPVTRPAGERLWWHAECAVAA